MELNQFEPLVEIFEVVTLEESDDDESIELEDPYCDICDLIFDSNLELEKHEFVFHGVKPGVVKRNKIKDHEIEANSIEPVSTDCHKCNENFADLDNLNWHQNTVHCNNDQLDNRNNQQCWDNICHICDKFFHKKAYLQKHIKNVHKVTEIYVCDICDQTYDKTILLKKHMSNGHFINTAEINSKENTNLEQLFLELNDILSNFGNHFMASEEEPMDIIQLSAFMPFFGKDDDEIEYLNGSNNIGKSQSPELMTEISNFDQQQPQDENMKNEIRIDHSKKTFKCSECDKTFTQDCNLKRHYKSAHSNTRYNCNKCSKSFTRTYLLNNHLSNVHFIKLDEQKSKVINFKNQFPTNNSEDESMEIIQLDGACPSPSSLKYEENEGEFDYKKGFRKRRGIQTCKICGQTLSLNTNLRAHIDSVHRKIKSSKCEYCNQKFGYGTSLKRHVQLIHESHR